MPTKKTAVKKSAPAKAQILKTITEEFISSLSKLKEQLSDKKFDKRIKKAKKLLAAGIKKAPAKKLTKKPVADAKKLPAKIKKAAKITKPSKAKKIHKTK